ncbi:MAG: tetratricopeptide repeat protein [Puniceicoccales bacterium]|nr:tetratricopeptide repeat protein [Puniceicoccales bacterium]
MDLKEASGAWTEQVTALLGKMRAAVEDLKRAGAMGSAIGVTDEEKNCAYALGYQLHRQKKYDKAEVIFRALCMLDPLNPDYLKARAATNQLAGNLPFAAVLYLVAYFIHPNILDFAILSGKCMVDLGRVLHAYLVSNAVLVNYKNANKKSNDRKVDEFGAFVEALRKSAIEADKMMMADGGGSEARVRGKGATAKRGS